MSAERRPFYLYFNHSLLHVPTIPRIEFQGATGNGDWADCLAELDHDFGDLLDALDELGVAGETIVVLAGDNGAENLLIARGSAGVFDGSYFTSSEGGLRTPCLIRWPGEIAPERASNEIVHQTDMFTTLLAWAGCPIPDDREIDGVDQRAFFAGSQATSNREGCLVWVTDVLHAVKWQNFKVAYVRHRYSDEAPQVMATPVVTNLLTDPKERESWPVMQAYNWVHAHAGRLRKAYERSIQPRAADPGRCADRLRARTSSRGWLKPRGAASARVTAIRSGRFRVAAGKPLGGERRAVGEQSRPLRGGGHSLPTLLLALAWPAASQAAPEILAPHLAVRTAATGLNQPIARRASSASTTCS